MSADEQKWLDNATDRVARAKEKGVVMLLVRRQDSNDDSDVVVTNADTPAMVAAMWPVATEDSE